MTVRELVAKLEEVEDEETEVFIGVDENWIESLVCIPNLTDLHKAIYIPIGGVDQ